MKPSIKALSGSLLSNVGPLAPILLAAALTSMYFAAGSVRDAATALHRSQTKGERNVTLRKEAIDNKMALTAAQRLAKLAPAVEVAVAGKYVVVAIDRPELFAEWNHALTELQSTDPQLHWEADEICISTCEGGSAAKAYVTAHRQSIKVD